MKSEKGFIHLLIVTEVLILVFVIVFGVVKNVKEPEQSVDYIVSTQNPVTEPETEEPETETEQTEVVEETEIVEEEPVIEETFSEEILAQLETMTLEEKVSQMLMVSPEALTGSGRVTIAGNATRAALASYPVGGMLYATSNYLGQTQMRNLITGAQSISYERTGRYLYAAFIGESAGNKVISAVWNGDEETLIALMRAGGNVDAVTEEGLITIPYFEDMETLAAASEQDGFVCVAIGPNQLNVVEVLQAGADMICVTEKLAEVHQSIIDAVSAGELTEDVINQAVGRILTQKAAISE